MAYPTLSDLKARLKITDSTADTVLTAILNGSVAWVESYTGRSFSGVEQTVTDEEHDLNAITQTTDSSVVMLRNIDVTAVTSVSLGDAVLDSSEYIWNSLGRVVIYGRIFDVANLNFDDFAYIKVTYKHNKATPADISEAILTLAMTSWNDTLQQNSSTASSGVGSSSSSSAGATTSEKIGDYTIQRGGNGSNSGSVGSVTSGTSGSVSLNGATINSISRILSHYRKRRV